MSTFPRHCSGLMYSGVPMIEPSIVRPALVPTAFEIP